MNNKVEKIEIFKFDIDIEAIIMQSSSIKILKFNNSDIKKAELIFGEDLNNPSLYIFKEETIDGFLSYYVGETDDFLKRIKTHDKLKEHTEIIVIFSTDYSNKFTSQQRLYFENLFINKIKNQIYDGIKLLNVQTKIEASKIHPQELYMNNIIFENLLYLISILDNNFFKKNENIEIYNAGENTEEDYLDISINWNGNLTKAKLIKSNYSVIVPSGSVIYEPNNNRYAPIKSLKLARFEENNDRFVLTEDLFFESPSSAACFITGVSSNGWVRFQLEDGRKIDVLRKSKTKS
ncbi:DUF4357 domain-containing protein [Spiroplasma alleghenense]|uniref:DUF4357 domain-containing protein n=1 Tax=Spiroplasma alleghenense TaxID=216931 RepID=A0A345Z4T5_9MOLU|nr:DUF4357 domain-containing protein [Spiroplasma alleghenense]AXK51614.1 hypothetical protein SALLE_v1c09440 [Spiroplasma alleghenense]